MTEDRPFPLPPPEQPPPLDVWLRRSDRAELGREPFFRGRGAEFEIFRTAAESLNDGFIGGGTMVFQGAPGAGKTALMQECIEAVRRHSTPEAPWIAVELYPGTLESAGAAVTAIVRELRTEVERLGSEHLDRFSAFRRKIEWRAGGMFDAILQRGASAFGISVGPEPHVEEDASEIFQRASTVLKHFHIVAFIDEAQNIRPSNEVRNVIDYLHRGIADMPLVAAFFGLGDTESVLRECGISRQVDERVTNLAPLSTADTECAIEDTFAAFGFVGPSKDRREWVRTLAQLSQGWPQHINRVAVVAARVVQENDGRLESRLLERALEKGQERKRAYYAGRLAAVSREPGVYKRIAIAVNDSHTGSLSRAEIMRIADSVSFPVNSAFADFLSEALRAGLLAPTQDLPHHYHLPIPSLGDYLRELPVSIDSG